MKAIRALYTDDMYYGIPGVLIKRMFRKPIFITTDPTCGWIYRVINKTTPPNVYGCPPDPPHKLSIRKLEKLLNSKSAFERRKAALYGYKLDVLINDKSDFVRQAVARQGYRLDVLVNDEDYRVRGEVASQGYGLDVLLHDEHPSVRDIASMVIQKRQQCKHEVLEHLKKLIERKYGTLDDERFSYLNGQRFSIEAVVKLINQADEEVKE